MLYDLRDKLQPIGRLDVLGDVAKKAKEYLDRLPKELVTPSRLDQQAAMLGNLGEVLVAQGKLQEALDAYQQDLAIAKRLAEQDQSNEGWQRDLGVSYEKVGDVLEAQCFGFLSARVARGLPLSFPGTTGVPAPMPGGRIVTG